MKAPNQLLSLLLVFFLMNGCQEDITVNDNISPDELLLENSTSSNYETISIDELQDIKLKEQIINFQKRKKEILTQIIDQELKIDQQDIHWDEVKINTDFISIVPLEYHPNQYVMNIKVPSIEGTSQGLYLYTLKVSKSEDEKIKTVIEIYTPANVLHSFEFNETGRVLGLKKSIKDGLFTGDVASQINYGNGRRFVQNAIPWMPVGYVQGSSGSSGPHMGGAPLSVVLQYALSTNWGAMLNQLGIIIPACGSSGQIECPMNASGYPDNYNTLNNSFSDLTIPNSNGDVHTPINNAYFYYFPGLKNLYENHYNRAFVYQINNYIGTYSLNNEQHLSRQVFTNSFFYWLYDLQGESSNYYYLHYVPSALEKIFNFFAEHNLTYNQTETIFPGSIHQDAGFINFAAEYLLTNDDLIPAYGSGQITEDEFEDLLKIRYFGGADFENELDWLIANNEWITETADFIEEHNYDQESLSAALVSIKLEKAGLLTGNYTPSQEYAVDQFLTYGLCCGIQSYTGTPGFLYSVERTAAWHKRVAFLKLKWELENPGQTISEKTKRKIGRKAFWHVANGTLHLGLDLCGLAPVFGEACDAVNGVIYLIEGDGINATLSFASTIPIIGYAATGTKFVKTYRIGSQAFDLTFKIGDDLVDFGSRNVLKRLLKPNTAIEQAHHIVPWASRNHEIIQLAAQQAWHPSHIGNGINLSKSIHNGWDAAHALYSSRLTSKLNDVWNSGAITNAQDAKIFLETLQTSIRNQFNAGKRLDEIVF